MRPPLNIRKPFMTRQIGCCKLCYCYCGLANTAADAKNDDAAAAFREFIPLGNTSVYVYDVFRDVGLLLLLPTSRSTAEQRTEKKRQFHHAFLHGLSSRARIGGCLRP